MPWTELISARMPRSSVTQSESGAGITVTALLEVPVVVSLPARRNSTRERLPVVIRSSGQSVVPTETSNGSPSRARPSTSPSMATTVPCGGSPSGQPARTWAADGAARAAITAGGASSRSQCPRPTLHPVPVDMRPYTVPPARAPIKASGRHAENLHLAQPAAELGRAERAEQLVGKRRAPAGLGAQEDDVRAVLRQRLAVLLEPGGDDHAVAERLEAVPMLGAGGSGDDAPGMDAEAQPKPHAVFRLAGVRFARRLREICCAARQAFLACSGPATTDVNRARIPSPMYSTTSPPFASTAAVAAE